MKIHQIIAGMLLMTAMQLTATEPLKVFRKNVSGCFPIVSNKTATPVLIDKVNDAEVVSIVADAFSEDIKAITGIQPAIISSLENKRILIIAGTIGKSKYIDQLAEKGKINIGSIRNQWETYLMETVNNPFPGVQQALVIAGSDRRGTAFGLFELSAKAGISPWIWWADVQPEPAKELYISPGQISSKVPDIKYRGIFINDEDWGLNPWAARNHDTDIRDIGPVTYARIFELLLRLKANFIWPAMHDSTKAFYYYPLNPVVADKYAIVIGSTHCDQMMRSNTFEWQKNFVNEYGEEPGSYRYDSNKKQVNKYWDDRVKMNKNYESVYTVGMRGVRDGAMSGPKNIQDRIKLMDTILTDQRYIFKKYYDDENTVPQIFVPYKEVLPLYTSGLKVPDDVTLIWTDDNYGYIRQLSNPEEQKRSGSSGIYYHLSYLGKPHDYLWLSSNVPTLISFEMTKAYQFGADRLWVVNVGDLKPAELETQFFLDLAFDTKQWTPEKSANYIGHWAEQNFGKSFAKEISSIKSDYYKLTTAIKPEHAGLVKLTPFSREKHLQMALDIYAKSEALRKHIPDRLQDAYFQLVEYPAKSASLMYRKHMLADKSLEVYSHDSALAHDLSDQSIGAYREIKQLTYKYNHQIQNGKWNGIITDRPRNLKAYALPVSAFRSKKMTDSIQSLKFDKRYQDSSIVFTGIKEQTMLIPADKFIRKWTIPGEDLITIKDLGIGGKSVCRYPFYGKSFQQADIHLSPSLEYQVQLKGGNYQLTLQSLPTYPIHTGRGTRLGIQINGGEIILADFRKGFNDRKWMTNVLRSYAQFNVNIHQPANGTCKIRIYFPDTGNTLNRLVINETEASSVLSKSE